MDQAAEPSFDDFGGWPGVLAQVASGRSLSAEQAQAALGQILSGEASTAHTAAFIFGLRCKGETVEEMSGLLTAMLAASERVVLPPDVAGRAIDNCGTGGDRHGTVNISTIASLVVAAAGVPVCKHGGRAASSLAGSADLLEALGVDINLGPSGVATCVTEVGIGFCFAPNFHPAMRFANPVRRELGVPTALNFLGPLANPARVVRQVVGVGDPAMADTVAEVLAAHGSERFTVVFGADGMDELSTTGPSTIKSRGIEGWGPEVTVEPEQFGLKRATIAQLRGGDAQRNAQLARAILGGAKGPQRDVVVFNAAAGLLVGGAVGGLEEGIATAEQAIDSGVATETLDNLVRLSSELGSP